MSGNYLSMEKFVSKSSDWATDKTDARADSRKMVVEDGDRLEFPGALTMQNSLAGQAFGRQVVTPFAMPLNDQALGQLNERLDGPPLRWLADNEHCPPATRAKLLTHLLALRDEAQYLVRMNGTHVRAVLSGEYTTFDHKQFVGLVAQAVERIGLEAQVWRVSMADEMRAYVLLPGIAIENKPGEHEDGGHGNGSLHPGLYISNSEVGTRSAWVAGGLYRTTCENGMIYGWKEGEVMRVRHIHISEAAMFATIASGVASGLRMSERGALAFIESQDIHLKPTGLENLAHEWLVKYGLSVERMDEWLKAIAVETSDYGRRNDPRLFDVTNALTFMAREKAEAERELMERAAGDMLFSPEVRQRFALPGHPGQAYVQEQANRHTDADGLRR